MKKEMLNQYCKIKGSDKDYIIVHIATKYCNVVPVDADIEVFPFKVKQEDVKPFYWKKIRQYLKNT